MVKHRVPNIVRGGVALPLDKTNYYLVRGRKHEQGGIDIGKNPRTGLEVEDGEVVHVGDKELRVFSAEPILGGVSPSQLVVRGVNPDKVFAAQERFKKVNGIKDDGTKAPFGTLKKLIFGVDFNDIKTSDGRGYNPAYIERAYSSLKKSNLTKKQQAVVLANIIEESGGDPFALNKKSGKDYGTLQWVNRYPKSNETDPYKEIDNQMGYFLNTVNNLDDQISWAHGGKGSGYQSRKDAYNDFNSEDIETINKGFVLGHVRPAGKHASAKNRIGVAEQIYDRIKRFGGDSDEDKYIKQKADSVIQTALHKSRTRKNVEVPLLDDPEYDKKLQAAYEAMITAQNDTIDPFARDILKDMFGIEGPNKAKIANDMADRYYKLLRHPNKSVGATCMYNASDCYGKEHRVPGNQTFKENPKKYGFNKIPIKDAKEGDLVQVINKYDGVPNHAMIINDASNPDSLTFNYVDGGNEERNIKINAKYPIDDMYTYDSYRFVGSPQDSVKWKNEYHRLNKKRFGGNMKHKLVEVNIGGNSKLIRVAKPSSTGESERSEGLTRKRAAIGTKTRKLEDGTVVPVYANILAENSTLENPIINPEFKKQEKAANSIESIKSFIKPNSNLISDVIGVGSNIIGSLITKRINNKALNSLTFQKPPVALMPSKLKTKININPQLDKMRESLADYERLISGNTASSRVALGRINRVRNQGIANTNQFYGQKENMETQLINQDAINQQKVLDRNLQQDYQYRAAKNAFENEVSNLKAENKVANVQNIVTGIQDLLTRREQRKMFNKTLTAETLANPNLPAEMYLKSGIWSKELYNMYRSQYPRKA